MQHTVEENMLLAEQFARLAYQYLGYARLADGFKDEPKMARRLKCLIDQAVPIHTEIEQVRKDYQEA